MTLASLYWLFVRYGLLSFGGGYVLISLFSHDLVEEYALLTSQEFGNLLAISQMTPGPIGINTATYLGTVTNGVAGGILATAGLLTPGIFLVLTAAYSFRKLENNPWMQSLLRGVRPATLGLLISAVFIFANISIFAHTLHPQQLLEWLGVVKQTVVETASIKVRWMSFFLAIAVALAAWKYKVNIFYLILISAILGAFLIR